METITYTNHEELAQRILKHTFSPGAKGAQALVANGRKRRIGILLKFDDGSEQMLTASRKVAEQASDLYVRALDEIGRLGRLMMQGDPTGEAADFMRRYAAKKAQA